VLLEDLRDGGSESAFVILEALREWRVARGVGDELEQQ
jgi:hypothetical protein